MFTNYKTIDNISPDDFVSLVKAATTKEIGEALKSGSIEVDIGFSDISGTRYDGNEIIRPFIKIKQVIRND